MIELIRTFLAKADELAAAGQIIEPKNFEPIHEGERVLATLGTREQAMVAACEALIKPLLQRPEEIMKEATTDPVKARADAVKVTEEIEELKMLQQIIFVDLRKQFAAEVENSCGLRQGWKYVSIPSEPTSADDEEIGDISLLSREELQKILNEAPMICDHDGADTECPIHKEGGLLDQVRARLATSVAGVD